MANPRVRDDVHEEMKRLAKLNGRTVQEEYQNALEKHIANKNQEDLLAHSKVEEIMGEVSQDIKNQMKKMEDRIVAMQARNGIDTSINLFMQLDLLTKLLKLENKEQTYETYRKRGAAYFSRPLKEK